MASNWVSILGAFTGTISLLAQLVCDRPRLGIEIRDVRVFFDTYKVVDNDGNFSHALSEDLALQVLFEIFNCGRYPCSIKTWSISRGSWSCNSYDLDSSSLVGIDANSQESNLFRGPTDFPYLGGISKYLVPYQLLPCSIAFRIPRDLAGQEAHLEIEYIANRVLFNRPKVLKKPIIISPAPEVPSTKETALP